MWKRGEECDEGKNARKLRRVGGREDKCKAQERNARSASGKKFMEGENQELEGKSTRKKKEVPRKREECHKC